jgi:hypothetical protein
MLAINVTAFGKLYIISHWSAFSRGHKISQALYSIRSADPELDYGFNGQKGQLFNTNLPPRLSPRRWKDELGDAC